MKDTFLIDNSSNDNPMRTMRLNVDPQTQKKLRAMKYVNDPQLIKLENNRIDEIKKKQEIEGKFYKTLTYVQKAKDLKKVNILDKMVSESGTSHLSISLIAGKPYYVYFLVYNSSNIEEIMQIVIEKQNRQDVEGDKSDVVLMKEKDSLTIIKIVSDPIEWRYICETERLTKPHDYNIITSENYVLIKPEEVVPVLIKIQSFDLNLSNITYNIHVNQKSGQSLYCLSLNLINISNLVDHAFNFFLPEDKTSKVALTNPFKNDPVKTELMRKNYFCSDSRVMLELDTTKDDFYFNYQARKEGKHREINFYFYADIHQSFLLLNWRVNLFSIAR